MVIRLLMLIIIRIQSRSLRKQQKRAGDVKFAAIFMRAMSFRQTLYVRYVSTVRQILRELDSFMRGGRLSAPLYLTFFSCLVYNRH